MDFIEIGDSREFFWDDCLVDTTHTTAGKRMHHPERREVVLRFDRPWEGSHCYFINMFRDGSKMRMYFMPQAIHGIPIGEAGTVCFRVVPYVEKDGVRRYGIGYLITFDETGKFVSSVPEGGLL